MTWNEGASREGQAGADADPDLASAGERIDRLLAQLASLPDPRAVEWAERLVRVVTDLYGEGLYRILAEGGPALVDEVAGDELVGALLTLHGLHPASLRRRVDQALAELPRMLGVEDARVVEADEDSGSLRIRLLLVPGSARHREQLEKMVGELVARAAPDAVHVAIDCPDTGAPVRFVSGPAPAAPVPAGGGP